MAIELNKPIQLGDIDFPNFGGAASGGPMGTETETITGDTTITNMRKVYLVDTSGGPVTLTLPSNPALGDILRVVDLSKTFPFFPCILNLNGVRLHNTTAPTLELDLIGLSITMQYTGLVGGWEIVSHNY